MKLVINGRDFSRRISTCTVEQEISHPHIITTIDGTEHYGKSYRRDVIIFSLIPYSDETATADYNALNQRVLNVEYSTPEVADGVTLESEMKLTSPIASVFGFRSIDGKRYYRGSEIIIRSIRAK